MIIDVRSALAPEPRGARRPLSAAELGDVEACRALLYAFFRALDAGRYDDLADMVTSDFTLEVHPSGDVVVGIDAVVRFVTASHGDAWLYRMHINHSLLFDRVTSHRIVATALCFHHLAHGGRAVTDPPPRADSVSNARYTFDLGPDGCWRLARREHSRIAPLPADARLLEPLTDRAAP